MARSSEAMGRWNGKAWRVNIGTRRVARRDQRRYLRECRDTMEFAKSHADELAHWADAMPVETVTFPGRIMIEAMEKILPNPHWVRGPAVSATHYFDKTNWEEGG